MPVQTSPGGEVTWVKVRAERGGGEGGAVRKTVTVEENPFANLIIQPWMEEARLESASPPGGEEDRPAGHLGWNFNSPAATVTLSLSTD